jgi:hypothetical protein
MSGVDPEAVGAEIETLVGKLSALSDSPAKVHAQELVRLLMSLYGAGLSRILALVRTEGGGPQAVLDRCAADPLLASLLALHDLHPHPIEARVRRALAGLHPHLPESTRVALVALERESVRVAVEGAPPGRTERDTLRLAIQRAIHEAAPELAAVEIDGLEAPLIQIVRSTSTPAAAAR